MNAKNNECQLGLIGLGAMGKNLLQNIADNGYSVVGFDKDILKIKELKQKHPLIETAAKLTDFVAKLQRPRKIMLLLPAGEIIDEVIAQLILLLNKEDIIMDCGNSFFSDGKRRQQQLKLFEINYLTIGISGGEEGARNGASIMPSGNHNAYLQVEKFLTIIAAKYNQKPCIAYLGDDAAGHYVKMVHNGIEYALMQILAEVYDIMKRGAGFSNKKISDVFSSWNKGKLHCYLIEIIPQIFAAQDSEINGDLIDFILDKGKQKGTGKWTSQNAFEIAQTINIIDEAVIARFISANKKERLIASQLLQQKNIKKIDKNKEDFIAQLEDCTYFAFLLAYSQGLTLLQAAAQQYNYQFNIAKVVAIWRSGCIIRAQMLQQFKNAYKRNDDLQNPLLSKNIANKLNKSESAARNILLATIKAGIAAPCLSAAIAYFDAYRSERLPTNLIQAQRDFFGAHGYQRVDKKGIFHNDWRREN